MIIVIIVVVVVVTTVIIITIITISFYLLLLYVLPQYFINSYTNSTNAVITTLPMLRWLMRFWGVDRWSPLCGVEGFADSWQQKP